MNTEELLEQIELVEAELEELKDLKRKYEIDEDEGFDHADDLTEIRLDIASTERHLKNLREQMRVN